MPLKKERFVEVYDDLSKVIDVDDSAGRSVPQNMNFIEEGFLSKDTGSAYYGATDATVESHSLVNYEKKDGTSFRIRAFGFRLQQYVGSAWQDLHRSSTEVTVSAADPALADATNHGLAADDVIYFTSDDTLPAGITADTKYYVLSTGLTTDQFQFSLEEGGTAVATTDTGTGTHNFHRAWTDDARFGWIVYDDELYGCNAVDPYFKFDGTDFTEYDSAPRGNTLEVFEDRMFMTGVPDEPLTIYYTNAGTPTTFPVANVLNPLGTDHVNGLVNYFGTLLIFKEESIWKLTFVYDQIVDLFVPKLEVQSGNYGACSRQAVTWVENDVWFFTGREVRSIGFQDQQIGILGVNTSVISEPIKETLRTISFNNFDKCAVFYEERRFYLSVPLEEDYNDNTFVCHTLHGNSWTKYTGRIKSNTQDYMVIDDVIYTATSVAPFGVVQWDEDSLDDNGTSFACEVFFDRIEDKDFNRFVFYRYLDLQFKDLNARVTVSVKVDRNDGRTVSEREFLVGSDPIDDEQSLGQVLFGMYMFGQGNPVDVVLSPFQKRRISFLNKGQAITVGLIHDNPGETFTLVQMAISGDRKPRKMFKPENILSV